MATNAGVGYSDDPDSEAAGREAAREALDQMGAQRADLVLLFATAKHDPGRLLRSVRSVVGSQARIVGGGGAGIITNHRLGYEGCQVGVAVLSSDSVRVATFVQSGLDADETKAGSALGRQLAEARFDGEPHLILLYESVKRTTPGGPMLNMGTPLLGGLEATLGDWRHVVGLGLHSGPRWTPGAQFFDDELVTQSVLGVVLSGSVKMSRVVMNNLRPMSTYRTVTAADGPAVLGIDGRPALEVIEELIGSDLRWEDYPLTVTLGVNNGDRFGTIEDADYANYLCVAIDRERRALIMSDTFLQAGTQVQLMRRHLDFRDIGRRADELIASAPGKVFFAFYIDCAGRTSAYVGTEGEEAAEVQRSVGNAMPLLGVYSGSEIARVGGKLRRMNHAGVLTVFSE